MRITDQSLNKIKKKRKKSRTLILLSLLFKLPLHVTYQCFLRLRSNNNEERIILRRKRHIQINNFNINLYSQEQCLTDFRFLRSDVAKIATICNFTNNSTNRSRYKIDTIAATCVMLRRLSAPSRWRDLETKFYMSTPVLSEIFWETTEQFFRSNAHLLDLRCSFLRSRMKLYARAVKMKGAPLHECVAFIDCTKIRMARPGGRGSNQRSVYSGHKKMHCLSYQTITTPDGLIFALWGPEVGRRHDLTLLRKSGWEIKFIESLFLDAVQYYVYCDSAYNLRPYMQVPFSLLGISNEKKKFNKTMSQMRVSVEWSYGELKKFWTTNDYSRILKVRQAPVSTMYKASVLLLNVRLCLYGGGLTSNFFQCEPPSIDEYLNL